MPEREPATPPTIPRVALVVAAVDVADTLPLGGRPSSSWASRSRLEPFERGLLRSFFRFRCPWPFLALVLAASGALNIAFTTGIIADRTGASTAQAILTAAAADTVMALFLTAVSAYR